MKIASWNVNSLNVRLPHLEEWLRLQQPDIVALQETKIEDEHFPDSVLIGLGYRSIFAGQKSYNGVAILSREPARDIQIGIPGFVDAQVRVIAATIAGLRIVNLYVVNGQSVGTDKYGYKLRWLDALHDWLSQEIKRYPELIVLGDFNIAPEDRDVHDPTRWNETSILTSTNERAALRRLQALGLHDSFRLHHEEPGHFSWWDYRVAAFQRNLGLRIDLVLISEALKSRCLTASIDQLPRTWDRPSDHAPVLIEIACP